MSDQHAGLFSFEALIGRVHSIFCVVDIVTARLHDCGKVLRGGKITKSLGIQLKTIVFSTTKPWIFT